MHREDDIQYDGEVLPPEGATSADYDGATPAAVSYTHLTLPTS